jgi:Transposase DDE domain
MYTMLHTYMSSPHRKKQTPRKSSTLHPPIPLRPACQRPSLSARQLLSRFRSLLPAAHLASWLASSPQSFYQRAFTPLITLWYCIFQRLENDHTLSHALTDARDGGADRLSPRGKPLSKQLRSLATTSLSDARQRLPLEVFAQTLRHSAQQIATGTQNLLWLGWRVVLLDGSTFRLRPFGDIPQHFAPHRPGNCRKPPYWCVVRVLAAFCLTTGAVLDCAVGSLKASEQALTAALLTGTWLKSLFVGDRNFGVYSVVRTIVGAQGQAVVRMTKSRAARLARSAGLRLVCGLDVPLVWTPSPQDQCPERWSRDPVPGRLLALRVHRPGFPPLTLYLFTTLTEAQTYSAQALVQLYGQRWRVELCLRFVKTEMELNGLDCQSADMARKEWLAGLIAYNLIRSVMAAAAAQAQISVHILSFSRSRQLFLTWLLRWIVQPREVHRWERLLGDIAQVRLPHRAQPRPPEPRAIRAFQKDFPKLEGDRADARRNLKRANAKS